MVKHDIKIYDRNQNWVLTYHKTEQYSFDDRWLSIKIGPERFYVNLNEVGRFIIAESE